MPLYKLDYIIRIQLQQVSQLYLTLANHEIVVASKIAENINSRGK